MVIYPGLPGVYTYVAGLDIIYLLTAFVAFPWFYVNFWGLMPMAYLV